MMRLLSRVALITGGNSGIGKATAQRFAAEGARVMIAARDRAKGEAVVAEITQAGGTAQFVACDVRLPHECQRAVDETISAYGQLDILFNNAGIVPYGTVLETSIDVWQDVFAINVHGTFYASRAALQPMIAQGKGVIINNASDWGLVGAQGAAAYAATKGAVVQLTRSMAIDHARQGIRVNAICPGDTYVERWRTNIRGSRQSDEAFSTYLQRLGHSFPMGRVGQVAEIASAVLFLASDEASYMTGQTLVIDGGNTAGGISTYYTGA
ncbi:MAG: glucose 1-dehydrogenase [Chloroflexota bacterium]|nr:glucose 1-dehydrogenase [Chloroflexota bacterium]